MQKQKTTLTVLEHGACVYREAVLPQLQETSRTVLVLVAQRKAKCHSKTSITAWGGEKEGQEEDPLYYSRQREKKFQ